MKIKIITAKGTIIEVDKVKNIDDIEKEFLNYDGLMSVEGMCEYIPGAKDRPKQVLIRCKDIESIIITN